MENKIDSYNKRNNYPPADVNVLLSLYDITKDGRIFNKNTGREYHPSLDAKGYLRIRLPYPELNSTDGRRPFKVHRLVAMVYLESYSEDLQVNHKNGNKSDNRVENLEMVTNRENVIHAWRCLDSSKRKKIIGEHIKQRTDYIKLAEHAALRNRKKIAKLDNDGNIVQTYGSLTDAAKENRVSLCALSYAAIHGGKRVGFYWNYL